MSAIWNGPIFCLLNVTSGELEMHNRFRVVYQLRRERETGTVLNEITSISYVPFINFVVRILD